MQRIKFCFCIKQTLTDKVGPNKELNMPEKKISITVRMPVSLHERVQRIAGEMSLENESQIYRWIIEAFLDSVESPEEVPAMSPVLEIARKVHQAKKETGKIPAYNI